MHTYAGVSSAALSSRDLQMPSFMGITNTPGGYGAGFGIGLMLSDVGLCGHESKTLCKLWEGEASGPVLG